MIKYSIFYHPKVREEDIPKISHNIQERIRKAIEERLLKEPLKFGEPLKKGLQGFRKLRIGDYRVIYRIDGNKIGVLKIGHRKDVYKKAPLRIFNNFRSKNN